MNGKIEVIKGDITTLDVDAIVNAANRSLLGGGGVDGAIHKAAGQKLYEECKSLGGCKVGEAKITKGYDLPAKYIIHTVGPVWQGGNDHEAKLLRDCYINSMKLAEKKGIKSLAFPNISTGVYMFPKVEAAKIAVDAVKSYLKNSKLEKVIFVCFNDENLELYKNLLAV